MMKKIIMTLVLAAVTCTSAIASDNDQHIKKVEDYFNQLATINANFVQVNQDGSFSRGKFYLSRPNKFRLNYDGPSKLIVISDGKYVRNYEKGNSSDPISLKSTPAHLIMRPNLKLSGDISVTSIIPGPNDIKITLINNQAPNDGSLTLVFGNSPFTLTSWTVHDIQGNRTQVTLSAATYNAPLPDKLFKLTLPNQLYHMPN